MDLRKLLDEKKIESVEKEDYSDNAALNDLNAAKDNLDNENYDWAVVISYNAVLRVIRSFMNSLGFRAIGKEHHKNSFEFLQESGFDEDLINYFDNIRKKRNNFVYRDVSEENKESAEETVLKAEDFVHKMRTFVQEKRTEENEVDHER